MGTAFLTVPFGCTSSGNMSKSRLEKGGGRVVNGYTEKDVQILQAIGRHDERLSGLEADFCKMEKVLQKIYFALAGIAGGVIVSLILLVVTLAAGR